jgi:hypothetical protein
MSFDSVTAPPGMAATYPQPGPTPVVVADPPLRQWSTHKTTTDKLDLMFQHVADNDGRVESAQYIGGRDWIVFSSAPVTR